MTETVTYIRHPQWSGYEIGNDHATVRVERVMLTGRYGRRYWAFVVTTSSGYRAELEECIRDECAAGRLTPCLKPDNHIASTPEWLRHIKTYCHDWHVETVEHFANQVLATYGARPRPVSTRSIGVRRGSPGVRAAMCKVPGWPDPEARAW